MLDRRLVKAVGLEPMVAILCFQLSHQLVAVVVDHDFKFRHITAPLVLLVALVVVLHTATHHHNQLEVLVQAAKATLEVTAAVDIDRLVVVVQQQ